MFIDEYERFFAQQEGLRQFIWSLIPAGSQNLIDLGCKRGNVTSKYSDKVDRVTALDRDLPAVSLAKQRYPEIKFLVARIEELPIKDHSFELAIISEVLHRIDQAETVIDELYRILVPGGLLILSLPHKRTRYHLDIEALLRGRFRLKRIYYRGTPFYPYYAKMLWYLTLVAQCLYDQRWRGDLLERGLIRVYRLLSWPFKRLMQLDFSLSLGRYSHNLIIKARRI